jgi:ATP-dependent Lhr-like helicase
MDITSIFSSPPLFSVRHGREEIGFVHESSFASEEHSPVVLLAGRGWLVKQIEWDRKIAYVEPTELEGRSRWLGLGPDLSAELCRSVRALLRSSDLDNTWSKRAREAMGRVREEYFWVSSKPLILRHEGNKGTQVWSFAGRRTNRALALLIQPEDPESVQCENLYMQTDATLTDVDVARSGLPGELSDETVAAGLADGLGDSLKFSECLPSTVMEAMLKTRYFDFDHASKLLGVDNGDNREDR